jgi:hypothetical protein
MLEMLTAVLLMTQVFWDVTLRHQMKGSQYAEEFCDGLLEPRQ